MHPHPWDPAIFDQAFQFMGLLDLDGHLLAANQTALAVIGLPAEAVVGRLFWETPWWTHSPEVQDLLRAAVIQAREGQPFRQEVSHIGADGTALLVDFSLTPIRNAEGVITWLLPEGRDITLFAAQREALAQEERKFRTLFMRSMDGMLLLEGDAFTICNPAVLAMMRCTEPEFLRMHPWELSPPTQPDGRPSKEKALEMIRLGHEQGGHRFEWIHRRADGTDFPVEVTLIPIPLGGREVLYTTWRDITARKASEAERLELERRMLHTQKLESLGILAGGIAHDFNNLLTAILGHLNLAQEGMTPEHPVQAQLTGMATAVQKASQLTRQMLAYSGRGRFQVEPHDLNQTITEIRSLMAASIPKKIQVDLDLAEGLPPIESDAAQIQQVVLNLVTNAADAIGDQAGRILLRTTLATLDATDLATTYRDWAMRPGPHVQLEVSDTGCGMDPEVLARIFDPFFTTKSTGRGLGLSAILGILKRHGAGMQILTAPGQGTTFRIAFQASERPLHPALEQSTRPVALQGKVLVVDDEDAILETSRLALAAIGLEVVMARDGLEAVQQVAAHPALALVLLDCTMPRMNGVEALSEIRRLRPDLPVILCSGLDPVEALGPEASAGAVLSKPYTVLELRQAVRRVLQSQ